LQAHARDSYRIAERAYNAVALELTDSVERVKLAAACCSLRRIGNNALTIFVIGFVLGGCILGVAFLRGLQAASQEAVAAENIVVMARGGISEAQSAGLSLETVKQLEVLPGARKHSVELVAQVFLGPAVTSSREMEPQTLRGVDPIGFEIRPVRIIEGRLPAKGEPEIVVGDQLRRLHPGLVVGAKLELPNQVWDIVGVFSASGSVYESELWGDRSRMMTTLKKERVSSVLLATDSADRAREMLASINASKQFEVTAQLDREFRGSRASLAQVAKVVSLLVIALCLIGVFITATNLHAALLARLAELTTLVALGVRRSRVSRLVLLESLLLAFLGMLVGVGIALALDGKSSAALMPSAIFELHVGVIPLAFGAALAVLVGLLGGLFPALIVRRIDLVRGLR
jgi:putative ABC transport system permease protein